MMLAERGYVITGHAVQYCLSHLDNPHFANFEENGIIFKPRFSSIPPPYCAAWKTLWRRE